jgi:aminoglycoside 6'-N-acetyltransferase I
MIAVREARLSDAAQWASMRHALWPEETEAEHAAEAEQYFGESERQPGVMPEMVLVAFDTAAHDELLGFVELSRRLYAEGCRTSPVAFLEGWYVVPGRRRQGVGSALIAASEAWARAHGCREFASDALADNDVSLRAHRALGFEEVVMIRCFRKAIESA